MVLIEGKHKQQVSQRLIATNKYYNKLVYFYKKYSEIIKPVVAGKT